MSRLAHQLITALEQSSINSSSISVRRPTTCQTADRSSGRTRSHRDDGIVADPPHLAPPHTSRISQPDASSSADCELQNHWSYAWRRPVSLPAFLTVRAALLRLHLCFAALKCPIGVYTPSLSAAARGAEPVCRRVPVCTTGCPTSSAATIEPAPPSAPTPVDTARPCATCRIGIFPLRPRPRPLLPVAAAASTAASRACPTRPLEALAKTDEGDTDGSHQRSADDRPHHPASAPRATSLISLSPTSPRSPRRAGTRRCSYSGRGLSPRHVNQRQQLTARDRLLSLQRSCWVGRWDKAEDEGEDGESHHGGHHLPHVHAPARPSAHPHCPSLPRPLGPSLLSSPQPPVFPPSCFPPLSFSATFAMRPSPLLRCPPHPDASLSPADSVDSSALHSAASPAFLSTAAVGRPCSRFSSSSSACTPRLNPVPETCRSSLGRLVIAPSSSAVAPPAFAVVTTSGAVQRSRVSLASSYFLVFPAHLWSSPLRTSALPSPGTIQRGNVLTISGYKTKCQRVQLLGALLEPPLLASVHPGHTGSTLIIAY